MADAIVAAENINIALKSFMAIVSKEWVDEGGE